VFDCIFRRVRTLAAASLLPLALSAPIAAAQTAASGWVETDTHALTSLLSTATDLGPALVDTALPLLVSLKLQNTSVLYGYFQHLTTPGDALYGHYLRPDQFAASYSPSMAQVSQVIGYLHAMGFTNITLSPNRTVIRMDGTVGLAQQAFNTQIHQFQLMQALGGSKVGSTLLANTTPALIPAQFGSLVLSVAGLNTLQTMSYPHRLSTGPLASVASPAVTMSSAGYTAAQFQNAYDVNPAVDGSQTNIAIIAEGDITQVLLDLRIAESMFQLPQVPFTVIQTGYPHTDTAGADEFDLDTQSSTGIANNVKNLYIYDSGDGLSDLELIDAFNRYVTDDLASAASASFGTCESIEYQNGELSAYDQVFLEMATQGQTLFSSSGDVATNCAGENGVPAGVPGVDYPASSPYVLGVGGTDLTLGSDNASYGSEEAWMDGGGGVSMLEPTPSWQTPVLPSQINNVNNANKGVPDIAMDGGTSAAVIVSGTAEGVTGTSLASPLALGAWARMQSANGNKLGYAPPALYALGSGPSTAVPGFHDITTGNNIVYSAAVGWDYTTGLGTFDIAKISGLLKPVAVTLPPAPVLGGSPCTVPGDLLAVGVKGSQYDGLAGHNALDVYIAEPEPATTNGVDSFVFTLQVDSLANVPPATGYYYYFLTPDGTQHYLAYQSTPDPVATSQFTYGTVTVVVNESEMVITKTVYDFTQVGFADAGSMLDTANNRIVWVLAKSEISGYVADSTPLSELFGETDDVTPSVDGQGQFTNVPVDDTPQGSYTPVGNASCLAATTTGGTTGGTTGSTTGTTTGGTTSGGTSPGITNGSATGTPETGRLSSGGAAAPALLIGFAAAAALRRRRRAA
jgi:pseudomonalisin/xanthomonalisin